MFDKNDIGLLQKQIKKANLSNNNLLKHDKDEIHTELEEKYSTQRC